MKLIKPKFWDKEKTFLSIFLFPITIIFFIIVNLRKILIRKRKFKIPIVCIGNLYIGGTGKTPLAVDLANELFKRGKHPVIIRKFYKQHYDEHKILKNKYKDIILAKIRSENIKD